MSTTAMTDVKVKQSRLDIEDDDPVKQYGVIVHWGLYSVPAYDDLKSAKLRSIGNGSEWYKARLTPSTYRPVSGSKETQAWHAENYNGKSYDDFEKSFATEKVDFDAWMIAAKSIGATYIILTAKHHDGYTLWRKNNLLQQFKDAALRHKLAFGFYYSWMEFGVGCTKAYLDGTVTPHLVELLAYEPQHMFFDGDWLCKTKYSQQLMTEWCELFRDCKICINDRCGNRDERKDLNYLGIANYRVYEDRALPREAPKVPWVHINTIGYSWGYNKQQELSHYKTGAQLYALEKQVHILGGTMMLNFGPDANGNLVPEELARIKELATLRVKVL
jgi:alpha-L-fucosidase